MAMRTLMAVGAHADDIELNVGGTLIKYRELGYDVVYVMSTNNMSGGWTTLRPDGSRVSRLPPCDEIMPQRKLEAAAAAEFFGTVPVHLDHPQRHYTARNGKVVELRYDVPRPACVGPDTPSILTAHEHAPCVQRLADLILERRPEAVLTHGPVMVDMEHVGTALLVTKAYRKAVEAGHDGMLLHWLDITPTIFGDAFSHYDCLVDVGADRWRGKLHAIGLHACQMPDPSRLDFPSRGGKSFVEAYTIAGRGKMPQPGAVFSQEVLGGS